MYGQNSYGIKHYGTNTLSDEDILKNKVDLKKYVPKFVSDIKEMNAIYEVQGLELGRLSYYIDDLQNQFFIDTATWGLNLWDLDYGIETDISKSYEERREIILAKKRGSGTVTKQMIKNTAESFSGGEVNIIEHNEESYFVVQFVGIKGIPRNLASFCEMLDRIKPAHLEYELKFTYTVWSFLKEKNLTWGQAKNKTWSEIKVYEEGVV